MIRTDSRKVEPGDVFVALPGILSNGEQYIPQAISRGASRIICRAGYHPTDDTNTLFRMEKEERHLQDTTDWIFTEDPRADLERILQEEYGDIISSMTLIAVTGTNGKTTTCYLIAQALNRLGRKCAYIGTIGFYLDGKVRDLPNTSVDICDLYELLLEAHAKGFDTVALEASSQGIDMGRLNTLQWDIAAFTNLTEDHLDYHKTMENYARAKQRLFRHMKPAGKALINADDPGREWFLLDQNNNCTYGISQGDFRAISYTFQSGTELCFTMHSGSVDDGLETPVWRVRTGLIGRYNVYNTMAVIGVLGLLGYEPDQICEGICNLQAPDGRCDVISWQESRIIIDYAHTPDAVKNILETAREFTSGSTYAVFGCTGDREREKRPVMTQLVLKHCTHAIITDDDPHSEPEEQIVADMLSGNRQDNYTVCLDRKAAIRQGIDTLRPGDTLLILGKGHENFILMNGYKIPHNDRAYVMEYLNDKQK